MAFPANVLALASAIGSQFLATAWGGTVGMAAGLNQILADLIAVETKLGTGASTATANTLLRGTGAGTTAYGQLVNADVANAAAIVVSKLAAMTNKTLLTSNGTTNAESASPTVSGTFTAETGLNFGTGTVKARLIGQGVKATGTSFTICSNSAANHGKVFVSNLSQGKGAIFEISGNFNVAELLCGSSTHFSIATATASKINVFSDGSNYFCQNGWATDQTLQVWYVGVG